MNLNDKKLDSRVRRLFGKAVKKYELLNPQDRVVVGLSGGKDSLALLHLLSDMRHRTNRSFDVEAVHVRMSRINYVANMDFIENFAAQCDVPLRILDVSLELDRKEDRTPCFLCSWFRRKALFNYAQENGFNKIALGHHQDDILRTAMMNLTFNGSFSTMPVYLQMDKFPIAIIRPLCLEQEEDLRRWAEANNYQPLKKTCIYEKDSSRTDIELVLEQMRKLNPESRYSLWHALEKSNQLCHRG